MRFSLIVIIIALVSSLCSVASAQETVKGKVFDNNTLEPLYGVYIVFGNNQVTSTGLDGKYSINPGPGKSDITFRFIGYKTTVRTVSIAETETLELNVGLDMDLMEIGQIVVSANRNEQKIAELTVSMDVLKSADFVKTHITDPEELISKSSGIEMLKVLGNVLS